MYFFCKMFQYDQSPVRNIRAPIPCPVLALKYISSVVTNDKLKSSEHIGMDFVSFMAICDNLSNMIYLASFSKDTTILNLTDLLGSDKSLQALHHIRN